jgi:hypothetical protein
MADNTISIVNGDNVIFSFTVYDADGEGMVLGSDAVGVVFTVRATETAEDPLLRIEGEIEYAGTSSDDPGRVSVELMPADTKDVATGEHWYDCEIRFLGHWFDFDDDEYADDLRFPFKFGRVYNEEGDLPVWVDVDAGKLLLTDDDVNYVEVTVDGEISSNTTGFTEDSIPLFTVRTDSGVILWQWPGATWFDEGAHAGLNFAYDAGKVIKADLSLVSVIAGSVLLEDDDTNYVEVDDAGTVSANNLRFTPGSYPLYTVTTASGAIDEVTKADQVSALSDERTVWTRGDRFSTVSKERFNLLAGITTPEDSAAF